MTTSNGNEGRLLEEVQRIMDREGQFNRVDISNRGDVLSGLNLSDEVTDDLRLKFIRTDIADQLFEVLKGDAIADAIRDLPEREQVVLSLYFYEQMTLKEIATVLKVTEGRASQLKTQALIRVQVVLKANGWE